MKLSTSVLSLAWAGLATARVPAMNDLYDYIVVGGGPSGIITASRLAEANKKVLLLERGQGPTVQTGAEPMVWNDTLTAVDVPALAPGISGYFCDDTPGSAACVLGGGVSINYLVFVRPAAHDFQNWPTGWKWDDIAPAAERLYERNPGSTLPSADGERYDQGLYDTIQPVLEKSGWSAVDMLEQPNEKHEVYSYPAWNIKDSMRAGPLRTYLPEAQKKPGFTLRTGAKTTRVIRRKNRVTGVEFEVDGKKETVSLCNTGRVVLSAGAMGTPRILFNSGIGPQDQIEAAQKSGVKVPSKKDWIKLPVGQNLKDHPIFSIRVQTDGDFDLTNVAGAINGTDTENISIYEEAGSGVLSQGRHRIIFFTSRNGTDGITRYYQGSLAAAGPGLLGITSYMTHGLTSQGAFSIHPNGTGYFSENVHLTTDADKEGAEAFVNNMVELFTSSETGFSLAEGTNATTILENFTSGNHYVGSAKMGADDGRKGGSSVVDLNTKVYGTDNLFVTDASMHPDLPTGNTQAIVMVAAEAAVAKILAYRG
ncbi:cellobiose dehydrogenase [Sarocladium strictum]